jgi:hypothetical protein
MHRKLKVIEAYVIAYANPLKLRAGDVVTVTRRETEPEWLGWVSETYLQIDGTSATVLRDYVATELAVCAGETVTAIQEEFGWAWVRNERALEGWVPNKNLCTRAKAPIDKSL